MLDQLKKDSFAARKEKDTVKANLLITLISEAEMIGKNDGNRAPTEDEVTAVIKKFLKGIDESMAALQKGGRDISKEEEEKKILESYLPSQMPEAELEKAILDIIATLPEKSPKMMGNVMAQLKDKHPNQYDGKMAAGLVKKLLS